MFSTDAWFAGFADGEGCFALQRGSAGWVQPTFRIGLRADDADILRRLQAEFGGSLTTREHRGRKFCNPLADWVVGSKHDLVKIVAYFDQFPPRAKKARDYEVWRRAVEIYLEDGRRAPELHALHAELRGVRKYVELEAVA